MFEHIIKLDLFLSYMERVLEADRCKEQVPVNTYNLLDSVLEAKKTLNKIFTIKEAKKKCEMFGLLVTLDRILDYMEVVLETDKCKEQVPVNTHNLLDSVLEAKKPINKMFTIESTKQEVDNA